ncbi:MAG: hypothetical protein LBV79_11130, partial [Candidatus Adiutrix sp.]|nr:hypothetical protein [Candidatus Adiutrix sp.]
MTLIEKPTAVKAQFSQDQAEPMVSHGRCDGAEPLRGFNAEQVLTLDRAWLLAQSLVAEAFRFDFEDFRSWPVDIKRYPELAPEEMAEGVFAQLFRYLRPGPALVGARQDYYRVCLYDPAILAAVAAEPGLALEPLLT